MFAEQEAELLSAASEAPGELERLVRERVGGTPLEHLLGWVEFRGRRIEVGPGVFVPRRRSALLVDQAIDHALAAAYRRCVVVDLCCGSGALGAAAASALTEAGIAVELVAADIDPVAVRCARRNLEPLGGTVFRGDLCAALPSASAGRIDLLLANIPYVPTAMISRMPPEARDYEPRAALDGGIDGLDVLRRVAGAAPVWLAPGGRLFVEISGPQRDPAQRIIEREGLSPSAVCSPEDGTVVVTGTRDHSSTYPHP